MDEPWKKPAVPERPDHLPSDFWLLRTNMTNYRVDEDTAMRVMNEVAAKAGQPDTFNFPIEFTDLTGGRAIVWMGGIQDIQESTPEIRRRDSEQTNFLNSMIQFYKSQEDEDD